MLSGRCLAVWEAGTREEFESRVLRFGRGLGFDVVSATTFVDRSRTHTETFTVHNVPPAYRNFSNTTAGRRDPVMQHCKHSATPIAWSRDTYAMKGMLDLWEDQAAFGLVQGIALAIHLPGDRHFFIGVDRDRPLDARPGRLTRTVADLQLFAVHAQDAALRIFDPRPPEDPSRARLTPRELEALRWTMDGKTAQEVGDALNISTRTAVFHLHNAADKLGCSGKYQAVLKAIKLGLLD